MAYILFAEKSTIGRSLSEMLQRPHKRTHPIKILMVIISFVLGSWPAGSLAANTTAGESTPDSLTPAMKQWAQRVAGGSGSAEDRSRRLLSAVLSPHGLHMREVVGPTRSAAEVFRAGRANCVSLAHLLVAMGRETDLPLEYAVSRRQSKPQRARSARVSYAHLVAVLPGARSLVLDFGGIAPASSESFQRISDREARAIYFSNLGAEALLSHRAHEASTLLDLATRLGPDIPSTWLNFGVALRRTGRIDAAKEAYRRALGLNREYAFARDNFRLLKTEPPRHHTGAEPDDS